jgi:hypothetical protein
MMFQGGAIAAAFAQDFPHLVAEKVVLIASTGLLEVCYVYLGCLTLVDADATVTSRLVIYHAR